jgi:hypothetical protein
VNHPESAGAGSGQNYVPSHSSFNFYEGPLMETHPKSRPQNRKRQHAEVDLSQDDLPSLPSKRSKSTGELQPFSKLPPPAFWDNLSKVWLTRRALKELDRRNAQSASNQSPVQPKVKKPRTRSAIREFKHTQSAIPKPVDPSLGRALLRFARHGGPDLSDLKGVCSLRTIFAEIRADAPSL